jgi:hypothetical protein
MYSCVCLNIYIYTDTIGTPRDSLISLLISIKSLFFSYIHQYIITVHIFILFSNQLILCLSSEDRLVYMS